MEIEMEERMLKTLRLSVPTLKCLLQLKGCNGPITEEHISAVAEMQGAELAVFVTHITNLAEPFSDICTLHVIESIRLLIPRYLQKANVLAEEYLGTCEAYQGYVGNERRV